VLKLLVAGLCAVALYGQPQQPYKPGAQELETLRARTEALDTRLHQLDGKASADLLLDAAIYHKAAAWLLRFPEQFYRKDYYSNALKLLDDGMHRADELEHNAASWPAAKGAVCRGYRSDVDGSIQPYCLWVPESYDPAQPARLDVILHGRNATLAEASFLAAAQTSGHIYTGDGGRTAPPNYLQLFVYGRGNNSYRWAGESDVFEALASVRRRYHIDPDRIVLRGFSMGGTGAWHLGLHFPGRWAAVEAGAGYIQTRPQVLATIHEDYRMKSLAIHDAVNCALNVLDVPFVAYAGEIDEQRESSNSVRKALEAAGYNIPDLKRTLFLVGPGAGHKYLPESKKQADAFIASMLPRRMPDHFRFVAYTPSYGEYFDLHIDSLEHLYDRAEISGSEASIETKNVAVLRLDNKRAITIDGQQLKGAVFTKQDGRWQAAEPAGLRKRAGLQGPIDDAFQQPFLCVPPATGADPNLDAFRHDFARYLRGDIRVKPPAAVQAGDVANYNLVLFGDPSTNPWIAKVLPKLPLKWTATEIQLAGRKFPAATNTVALIYPNPLNPRRYVVLNTGHTFPGKDFDNMHWFLHPRLADYAVLDKTTREVRLAGFFDETWR
jgi:hypothetical protein